MADMSFADAVRSIARLRPLVTSGVLGATVACTLVMGAMAAEAPEAQPLTIEDREVNLLNTEADMHKVAAEFYTKGALAIAQADFSRMSPRDAVLTIKSMARATLDSGPEIAVLASDDVIMKADQDPRVVKAMAGATNAYKGATVVRAFVERLTREPVASAGMAREEARGSVLASMSHLKAAGIDVKPAPHTFDGVEAEMKRAVGTKVAALQRIAAMKDDPDADPIDAVETALGGQTEMQPAMRVLLGRLAADAIQDPDVAPETKVELIKGMAIRQAADGAFEAIVRQSKEEGPDADAKRMAVTATIAMGTIGRIETAEPERTMAPR